MKKLLVATGLACIASIAQGQSIPAEPQYQLVDDKGAVRALAKASVEHFEEFQKYTDSMTAEVMELPPYKDEDNMATVYTKVYRFSGVELVGGDVAVGSKTLYVSESCVKSGILYVCHHESRISQ